MAKALQTLEGALLLITQFVNEETFSSIRVDIHAGGNRLATGLAYNRGVCDHTTRCAVIEDESPMAMAHTVAHELGHL